MAQQYCCIARYKVLGVNDVEKTVSAAGLVSRESPIPDNPI